MNVDLFGLCGRIQKVMECCNESQNQEIERRNKGTYTDCDTASCETPQRFVFFVIAVDFAHPIQAGDAVVFQVVEGWRY